MDVGYWPRYNVTIFTPEPTNASGAIYLTVLGIRMDFNLAQPANALDPIDLQPGSMVTLVKFF